MKKIYAFLISFFSLHLLAAQVIVIDAGHGYCSDCTQGCTSAVRSDHEILTNMAVALKLDSIFSSSCQTITTHLTRNSNACGDFPSLSQRAIMSNNWGADRFLSIHCNAGGGTGTETFWCNNSASSNQSCSDFAHEVQNQMVSYGSWNYRRCVEDYTYLNFHLGVLHPTNAIGCLSEIGFVDYPSDLNKLLSESWRNQFALAYYHALQNDLNINCNPPVLDCSNAVPLTCGVNYTGTSSSASSNISTYGCNNWTETGPERVHTITPSSSGTLSATISNFPGDLDVYILGSCDPNDCLGTVSGAGAVYNNATAGHTYYVVVDADDGTGGGYDLVVNCPTPQHDITVANATITSGSSVQAGSTLSVSAVHTYSGNTLNLPTVDLAYYLSADCSLDASDILLDVDASTIDLNSPTETETETLTIPQNTVPGSYHLLFVADNNNNVVETDESNNISCVTVTVLPPPTLDCSNAVALSCGVVYTGAASSAPSNISSYGCNNWTETGPERVHTITPTFTGTLTATISNFAGDLDVYILGSCDPNDCLGTVNSYSATYTGAVAGQTYYIVVDADDGSGGSYDLLVDCPVSSEDLTLSNAAVSPSSINTGGTLSLSVNHIYSGSQTSALLADVSLAYYISTDCSLDNNDILLGASVSNLGTDNPSISESETFALPNGLNAGNYYILFVSDYQNVITENNETNNILCEAFSVIIPNDIYLDNMQTSVPHIDAGNTIQVSGELHFTGSTSSQNLANVTCSYYLSEDCNYSSSDILLDADLHNIGSDFNLVNLSATLIIPDSTSTGSYYILTIADDGNFVIEADETNNTSCIAISVNNNVPNEDIYLANATVQPSSTTPGGTINVQVEQSYTGVLNSQVLSNTDLAYYLSVDCNVDANDFLLTTTQSNLGSDNSFELESEQLTIPATLDTGSYHLLIWADANNDLAESNENNNTTCVAISVETNNVSILNQGLENEIRIYPNPTSGKLFIKSHTKNTIVAYRIFDLFGKVIHPKQDIKNYIDISELKSAYYFVELYDDRNQKIVFKVLKKE